MTCLGTSASCATFLSRDAAIPFIILSCDSKFWSTFLLCNSSETFSDAMFPLFSLSITIFGCTMFSSGTCTFWFVLLLGNSTFCCVISSDNVPLWFELSVLKSTFSFMFLLKKSTLETIISSDNFAFSPMFLLEAINSSGNFAFSSMFLPEVINSSGNFAFSPMFLPEVINSSGNFAFSPMFLLEKSTLAAINSSGNFAFWFVLSLGKSTSSPIFSSGNSPFG